MESGADILLAGAGDIEGIATDRERFGHLVQMAGTLFAVARYPSLIANPCGQIPNNQTDGEHHAKRQQILNVGYRQRPARSDKHQVKAHHVNHRRQYRRPAAVKQRNDHHAQQIQHHQVCRFEGHQPLCGDKRNGGAQA